MNSVDWVLVRGDVKGLNWNELIRLNEALLRIIKHRVTSGQLWSERETSIDLITGVSRLTV